MLDSTFFVNPSRNTGMNFPPPDAVQEFRLLTSNFDAEYGRNSGSQAMVMARAGANDFHGDVWEFLRNNDLNARNFFASTVPTIKENQFGGTAGGPIKKDKVFFFGSYQGLRSRPQSVPNEVFVPSAAERNGDFTDLLPRTVLTNPINPNTGQPLTTSTGTPSVTNNIIDPSCITGPSKNILSERPGKSLGNGGVFGGFESMISNAENVNSRVLYEPGILTPSSRTLGNDYRSWYNSFQAQVTRRMSRGLTVTGTIQGANPGHVIQFGLKVFW